MSTVVCWWHFRRGIISWGDFCLHLGVVMELNRRDLRDSILLDYHTSALLILKPTDRLIQVHIMAHGRTEVNKPHTLSLGSTAQILSHSSTRSLTDRVSDSDNQWMTKVSRDSVWCVICDALRGWCLLCKTCYCSTRWSQWQETLTVYLPSYPYKRWTPLLHISYYKFMSTKNS